MESKSVSERFLEDGHVMVRQLKLEQAERRASTSSTRSLGDPMQLLTGEATKTMVARDSDTGSTDSAWEAGMLDVVFDDGEVSTSRGNTKAWQQPVKDQLAADLMAILNEIGQDDSTGGSSSPTSAEKDAAFATTEPNYMF
jgi:hypothetical protein